MNSLFLDLQNFKRIVRNKTNGAVVNFILNKGLEELNNLSSQPQMIKGVIMNKAVVPWAMTDIVTQLFLQVMLTSAPIETEGVMYEWKTLPKDTLLVRLTQKENQFEAFQSRYWSGIQDPLDMKERLLIDCHNQGQNCLNQFQAESNGHEKLYLAIPQAESKASQKLLYESCAVNNRCADLTIVFNGQQVYLKEASHD